MLMLTLSVFPKYGKLSRMVKDFQPYYDLWTTVSDWIRWHESWMNDSLAEIEAEQVEKNVSDSFKTMQRCVKQFKDLPGRYIAWGKEVGAYQYFDVKRVTLCSEQGLSGCHMNVLCVLEPAEKMLAKLFSFFFLLELW